MPLLNDHLEPDDSWVKNGTIENIPYFLIILQVMPERKAYRSPFIHHHPYYCHWQHIHRKVGSVPPERRWWGPSGMARLVLRWGL